MPVDPPRGVTPTYSQQYRRCGKPSCPLCVAGGRGHGPYWYAYWREDGRARSRYLGKRAPPGAASPQMAPPAPIAQPGRPGLRARALGGFALWRGEERLAVERWDRQQRGVLCKWLLSVDGHRLTRDEVVERFWPDGASAQGTINLRGLVHRLRRALDNTASGVSYLHYDGEMLTLAPGGTTPDWLDAVVFAQTASAALAGKDAGACRRALALYTGDYLPADAYEEWALTRREELRQQRLAVLLHLATLCGTIGEVEEAEACLHTVLTLDRYHESAALALMRLYAAAGRPGQALRIYQRFAEALHDDLALKPEEETQALARALAAQQAAAPALAVPDMVPNNLPMPLTSFIGRRRALAELRSLLQPVREAGGPLAGDEMAAPCRLLTLTGPGGTGKTRLALQLAHWLLDKPGAFPDGVWLVELASLAEPAQVAKRLARALSIQEEATRPLLETLAGYLKTRRLLLLLDNCEHLRDACAELVAALLVACPGLQVLATSRAALGVPGELPRPVPGLSLPASGENPVGRLLEFEAVRLFLERARARRPELVLTDENASTVTGICRRLEGIPLALELAAARVNVLGVEQIADRLGESFGLLTGGPCTAPRRQQTLRATLDWSYDLLNEPERTLLRRLAVFAGGCTLDAVEAVCAGEGIVEEQVLDLLDGLVGQSLVEVNDTASAARYRLLEPVRQYGQLHLAASGEAGWASRQHLGWCSTLAQQAAARQTSTDYPSWLPQLEAEHDNMRAALDWAMGTRGDLGAGIQLAGALWGFWMARGHLREGRHWLDQAVQHLEAATVHVPDEARSQVLYGAAVLAWSQGDSRNAIALQDAHLALLRRVGDPATISASSSMLGMFLLQQGDYARAAPLLEEGLRFDREHHQGRQLAVSLTNLGMLAFAQGDRARALALHRESLAIGQELGDTLVLAVGHSHLGLLAFTQGDNTEAVTHFQQSAALHWELQDTRNLADALDGVAVAGVQANPARSAFLFGATQALRETLGAPLAPLYHTLHATAVAASRALLGDESFAEQWQRGQTLSLGAAVELAVHEHAPMASV